MKRYRTWALIVVFLAVAAPAMALSSGPGLSGLEGVQFETAGTFADMERLVGEEVCFTLTAKDENGNVIRSWDQIGKPTTITLYNSTANTDTSTQSWNADPEGYSWAIVTHEGVELTKITANEWSIPETKFKDGMATICLLHTKADTGVYLEITPTNTFLNQVSASVTFISDEITNYLVDLTSSVQGAEQIYLLRPYEIVVAPRDRYLNVSDKTIKTRFTARFPGEFDQTSPGLATIFSGDVFITGLTNYLIASRIPRVKPTESQWIRAFHPDQVQITGQTNAYEILDHAPNAFDLLLPADHATIELMASADLETFTWERPKPADPYTDIQISRFDPKTVSDEVRYTWVIVDSVSLTNARSITSDNGGLDAQLTLSHSQLWNLMTEISGSPFTKEYAFAWFVEATDGLYTTKSDPLPGHYLGIKITNIASAPDAPVPTVVSLEQNYPNPFNPSTSIRFSTTNNRHVLLRIYDLVGSEVAVLVDQQLQAGTHTVNFSGSGLTSGVYVYRLETDGTVFTKRMVLMK